MNEIIENIKNQPIITDFIKIVTEMDLGESKLDAGLIYYAIKQNKINLEEIKDEISDNTLSTIKILEKLDSINFSMQNVEAENLRKMFFAITKDIRIIMLKIAFTVADLRNLNDKDDEYKLTLSRSIFALYAPLAARLGLSNYKTELEDGAFKLQQPELQQKIQQEVDNRFHKREPIVERLKILVENCLKDLNITGKVYGRKKHIYSIYKKLQDHDLNHIYDLIAVRAIVKTVSDCYALLGKLHSFVEPMQKRFKDYIAIPKPNGYQSLHTTVTFEGFPVEVQIRTEEMHKYAEYGIAAHWMYKEKRNKQDSLDVSLAWLRQMMENEDVSIDELANSLNNDIYNNEIFVQTPKGKVVYLPNGSTPIDFAYSIHSEVGNKCIGAKINNKISPTNSILKNGDVVEIITNPNSKGPSRDWLKICKTSEARSKINSFFKKNMKEETIKLGKSMLENAIKEKGYATSKLLTNNAIEDMLSHYNMSEIDELYTNIGTNAISAKLLSNRLVQNYQKQVKIETTANPQITLTQVSDKLISIKGLNNILIKFAGCCHPMHGDDIIGFISTGRGIIIHRKICPNVSYFDDSRIIEANWKPIEVPIKKSKTKKSQKTNE